MTSALCLCTVCPASWTVVLGLRQNEGAEAEMSLCFGEIGHQASGRKFPPRTPVLSLPCHPSWTPALGRDKGRAWRFCSLNILCVWGGHAHPFNLGRRMHPCLGTEAACLDPEPCSGRAPSPSPPHVSVPAPRLAGSMQTSLTRLQCRLGLLCVGRAVGSLVQWILYRIFQKDTFP